ncbi:MAG TPA: hypothetical protein VFS42_05510, partial [Burkholderiaceae bacterium]|nr:hypothetical protein [Burkholderiaceae bacterium]
LAARTHPDLKRVRPAWIAKLEAAEAIDDEAQSSEEGGEANSGARTGRAITIDMARGVAEFVALAAHRGGRRVVLLYPAEALRAESANALLKTLEEPTPGVVFVLVAAAPDALLPTIASRCRRVTLGAPSADEAMAWLRQTLGEAADHLPERLAAIGQAPLELPALEGVGYWEAQDRLLDSLEKPASLEPIALARTLDTEIKRTDRARQQGERAAVDLRTVVAWLQRWITDVISLRLTGTHRYYPRRSTALASLADGDLGALLAYARFLNGAARDAGHAVNTLLFLEDCLLRYRDAVTPRA